MVGILDKDSAETLFVANLDGSIERFVRLDGKATKSLRWSQDGGSIGVVDANHTDVFRSIDLEPLSRHEGKYLSDVGFDPYIGS